MTTYKTATGRFLDIGALKIQQEKTIAVGNSKQNARGDILGKGGEITRTRDEVMTEYYNAQKTTKLTDSPIHHNAEAAAIAQVEADVFENKNYIDEIAASKIEPTLAEPTSPPPSTGGISDAISKSQELAERLKRQRNRI